VLPDALGGVASFAANLLQQRRPDQFRYAAVLAGNAAVNDTRTRDPFAADRVAKVAYSLPPENLYSVLRRVTRAIQPGPGVLVSNDWIELAAATVHDTGRTVVAVTHGDMDWYYQLAERHSDVVDLFIAISTRIRDRLLQVIPHRADSIVLQPFGVRIPAQARAAAPGRLRVAYVGRLKEDKGIYDLPLIDRALLDRGVDVQWTIQGAGPHGDELRARWSGRADIQWNGYQPTARVLEVFRTNDVLVMPSRAEGLPVSLLEAGAAGCVPVISNLPSGIPDVVTPGVTGFRPEIGDVGGFAAAIARLADDRALLEAMSTAVRAHVAQHFDEATCTAAYQAIYARYRELKRPRPAHLPLCYGSRRDQPWLPNAAVRLMRSALRRMPR
jgi:glycosyltransferase involved in cell wall biosynthesis